MTLAVENHLEAAEAQQDPVLFLCKFSLILAVDRNSPFVDRAFLKFTSELEKEFQTRVNSTRLQV